jgi:hypothetical protein
MKEAQDARRQQVMEKYSFQLNSFRQRHPEIAAPQILIVTEPRVQYNRRKWNRMDSREQAEYEKKLKGTKTTYGYGTEEVFIPIPKLVFDVLSEEGSEVKDITINIFT